MIIHPDIQYALSVCGGAVLFFIAWWLFCFLVRNGIDGTRKAIRFARSHKRMPIRKWFIGDWK